MERWILKLNAVNMIDSPDSHPVIEYTNSSGDKIKIHREKIEIRINNQNKVFNLKSIKSVEMNPMFKNGGEEPYFYIRTTSEDIKVSVDTNTGGFHDLSTVYDYIRRIKIVRT